MSEDSDDSKDTWCKGPGPESDVIRHWQKARNIPPKSWREENRKLMEEKED